MASRRRRDRFESYVPMARRRQAAAREHVAASQRGRPLDPVRIAGRGIARTVWGKAWCRHIESFHDFSNRLPRGRTYVRNGSVIDLVLEPSVIRAQVMGSELYHQEIGIAPCAVSRWQALAARCRGGIGSVIELLEGRLSASVMAAMTDRDAGLLPDLSQVELSCSCPDWATLCKHLAAVLYGVGARLDDRPELLFVLRGVSPQELMDAAEPVVAATQQPLDPNLQEDLEAVFGIQIDWHGSGPAARRGPNKTGARRPSGAPKKARTTAKRAGKRGAKRGAASTVTRRALLARGVPTGTISTWLQQGVLLATAARGVYGHTEESRARLRRRRSR